MAEGEVNPEDVVQPGQAVTVRIIRIDAERKRIGLSLKRAGDDYDRLGVADDAAEPGETEASAAPDPADVEPESQTEAVPEPAVAAV
jgi:transcriptional accessory protein Tex/SPT6